MLSKKTIYIFTFLFFVLGIAFVLAILSGGSGLSIRDAVYSLVHPTSEGLTTDIIWKIRMPRIFLGLLVGAGLATCGSVFQGLLRNPLAEPYTLGVSGGAALGVTLGIISSASALVLPFCATIGSGLSIMIVYIIASKKRFSNPTLILGGVVLSYLFSSLVLLIFAVSKSDDVYNVILWLMGDLSSVSIGMLKVISCFIILGIGLILLYGRELNILTLGEEKAQHLGVNAARAKKILFVLASLITGACVAASGMVGFVGLMIPHIMRRFVGPDHKILLPASCIAGSIFLIFCDALARIVIRPLELPVGVITGIFGGLFFLYFLLKSSEWEIF